jgi:hypothetical protein
MRPILNKDTKDMAKGQELLPPEEEIDHFEERPAGNGGTSTLVKHGDVLELARLEDSPVNHFMVVQDDFQEQMDAIEENLAGGGFTPYSFDRIKVPSGGATAWEIPQPDGSDPETAKEFSAVIGHQYPVTKSYWPQGIEEGGNKPPACFSMNGLVGIGDPGGPCATCPHNQWGTGKNGGKACPDRRMLFLVQEHSLLPTVLLIPGGSAKNVDKYIRVTLSNLGIPYYGALTKFKLRKEKNRDGIDYAQIVPSFSGKLPRQHALQIKAYGATLDAALKQTAQPAAGGDLD